MSRSKGFFTKCMIAHLDDRRRSVVAPKLWVNAGSEYTWVPARILERIGIRRDKKDVTFMLANGQTVARSVGLAIVRLDKYFTTDEIVFAEPGDLGLLDARTLAGLNLTVDAAGNRLHAAGPVLAA